MGPGTGKTGNLPVNRRPTVATSRDLLQLGVLSFYLTLRYYPNSTWTSFGFRRLCYPFQSKYPRVALDLGKVSVVFERYWD
jgi:hypothetical protein